MVVGASITVNNSRNSGDIDSGGQSEDTKVLKQILGQLKEMNKQTMVASRKASSFGGGAAGGGLAALLGGSKATAGIMALLAGGAGAFTNAVMPGAFGFGVGKEDKFSKFAKTKSETGEESIIKINRFTGDIEEVLSMEEAERRNIVDKLGKIDSVLALQEDEEQGIFKDLEKIGDSYAISNVVLRDIKILLKDQKTVDKEILELKKRERTAQKKITEEKEREARIRSIADASGARQPTSREIQEGRSIVPGTPLPFVSGGGSSTENVNVLLERQLEALERQRNATGPTFSDLLTGGNFFR
jgi:hypothetical protein